MCWFQIVLHSHLTSYTIILTEGLITLSEESIRWQIVYPGLEVFGESRKGSQETTDLVPWALAVSWFCHKLCDRKWLQFLSFPFFYLTNNRILDDLMPTWAIYVEIYHHSFFSLASTKLDYAFLALQKHTIPYIISATRREMIWSHLNFQRW